MPHRSFRCDIDGPAEHLAAADRAYAAGRVVIYVCQGRELLTVQAEPDELPAPSPSR